MNRMTSKQEDGDKKKRRLEGLDRGPGTVWRNELAGGMVQEGTSRGAVAHGPFREWFPNGQLRIERSYRDGELHGLCRQYITEGKLVAEFAMQEGDGILLETWDTGILKLRWWHFHLGEKACGIMECFDTHGKSPVRSYTWKGSPCRTKKRFLSELIKCGFILPSPDTIDDPLVWAKFAQQTRAYVSSVEQRKPKV